MRHKLAAAFAALFSLGIAIPARGAVFQWTVEIPIAKNPSAAFLWIPPEAKQVRGVIMAGMTVMEREFVQDPAIRKACADQQLAIVFLKCGLAGTDLQKVLDNLAAISGYGELSTAPLMFVGHSAGGPQAHDVAVKYAARCFGLVQYRGGGPWNGEAVPAGIPSLIMAGQFDDYGGVMRDPTTGRQGAWWGPREGLIKFRGEDESRVASMVVEPGAGHFPWSERNADYLAMFIQKAAAACIAPERPTDGAPPALKRVDYKTGWLTDMKIESPQFEPAAYADYKGDKGAANWHFDKEMADATVAYHNGINRKDQFVLWKDSYWVDAGTRYFFQDLKWVWDGATLEVHPVYAEKYPQQAEAGKGPKWPQSPAPVGHCDKAIEVRPISGPMVVGKQPQTVRMNFNNLAPATEAIAGTFLAFSRGNEEYRYTEQVGMLPRGYKGLGNGKDNRITFGPIADQKADAAPIDLGATSSAGLPVEYYVAAGPAEIVDGKLKLMEIPTRAKFPIEVKVVAWQFGSGVDPKVKTAAPVTQTFKIEKP